MAKKAKRRGRPPGSKNRKSATGGIGKSFAKMDVPQLRNFVARLQTLLAAKVQQQREFLEAQLAELSSLSSKDGDGRRRANRAASGRTRRRPEPKYQSKKDKRLKWTGRGVMPVWMREEMKGTKLKKDDFLIK